MRAPRNHHSKSSSLVSLVILQSFAICWLFQPSHGFHVALPTTSRVNVEILHPAFRHRQHALPPRQQQLVPTSSIKLSSSSNDEDESSDNTIDPKTKEEIRNIANYLAKQTVESLLSPSEARAISNELLFDNESSSTIFNDKSYQQYVKYWQKVERRLREENQRTPADILGKELTDRILSSIRGDDTNKKSGSGSSYDAQTVRTFLESDAVNSLFTQLLYDAIFEFTTKFDILGNAISNLPLLGPVRNQVLKESKRNMDRTLGPLLQRFLSGYTRVAIRQAVDFVVSEENASAFGKANARLVEYLLQKRTVADWIPEEKVLVEWREEVWAYLVGLEEGGGGGESSVKVKEDQKKIVEQSIEWAMDLVGDRCLEDAGVDVNEILDASPTLERSLGSFWQRCQDASIGR
mmetsp:Transcript_11550/g.24631  ORF Transcript_11550/g.24631 Transcript_11550/m.24631 type:complete len:407 (-) Transcript_11550:128-1348(-)|eukprot:CAMPEP_0183730560 /NCGR_PEP_ID=MMETSP0737-20130205/33156_1 /TAXON_ID=385413 /ORGANISM="Thalassiosira miniscula, Strain CCMP1093" /LENGTH=406 /DNA_ID=CAMNT_0025963087 /DNA_START=33 /DNA_END=1253 /DNA_ORIENTATION=+